MTISDTNQRNWGGYQALAFVLRHALYVRDDQWINTMIDSVDFHLQVDEEFADETDKLIPWNIDNNDELFDEAAVEAILIWLNCGASFRKWFVKELNTHNGRLMDAHEESSFLRDREELERTIIETEQVWLNAQDDKKDKIKTELDRLVGIAKKMDGAL